MSCILLSRFPIFTHISLFLSPDLQNMRGIHTYKYPWPDLSAANPLCRRYQRTVMVFVSVHGGGIHLNPLLGNNLHKLHHLLGDWRHKTNYSFRANVIAGPPRFCVCSDIVLWSSRHHVIQWRLTQQKLAANIGYVNWNLKASIGDRIRESHAHSLSRTSLLRRCDNDSLISF